MVRSPNAAMRIFRRISGGRRWKKALSEAAADAEDPKSVHEGVGVKAMLRDVHGDRSGFGPSRACLAFACLLRSFALLSRTQLRSLLCIFAFSKTKVVGLVIHVAELS